MSAQPVLYPACGAAMDCLHPRVPRIEKTEQTENL